VPWWNGVDGKWTLIGDGIWCHARRGPKWEEWTHEYAEFRICDGDTRKQWHLARLVKVCYGVSRIAREAWSGKELAVTGMWMRESKRRCGAERIMEKEVKGVLVACACMCTYKEEE
jgi:hypothetical protein